MTRLLVSQFAAMAVGSSSWPILTPIENPDGFVFGIGVATVPGIQYLLNWATSRDTKNCETVRLTMLTRDN